ncbi:SMI1/KNR4 family protein [Candidatus Albibeggiatoa sp. nov. NOAA]|uniref:SMI1/KNR4 family protein n=1 Tax=Candidatus Albibeggiatoa sp. nov. NOAA TaxID=3162724 RepID=UPI0033036B62|nr:SMI1/KNR4 family protein [Thiotrichaceae bacterium]
MTTLHHYWHDYIERCKQSSFKLDCNTFPAATRTEIQALEQQYNITLPTSYKALLELTNGFHFFDSIGPFFYSVDQIASLIDDPDPDPLDMQYIWYEQLQSEEYQFLSEDLDFFHNRDLDVVNREGKKIAYPPKSKHYLFSNSGEIVDINGEQCLHPPADVVIRNSQTLTKMQDGDLLLKYSDYKHLAHIGSCHDIAQNYAVNLNYEPQKGEPEAWLISPDYGSEEDCCLKFLNFIELAEFTLLGFEEEMAN